MKMVKIVLIFLSTFALSFGSVGLFGGIEFIHSMGMILGVGSVEISSNDYMFLDSTFRFNTAVWFVQGFALLYISKDPVKNIVWLKFVFFGLVLGGIGRLLSLIFSGYNLILVPPMVFEVVVIPVIYFWLMGQISKAKD